MRKNQLIKLSIIVPLVSLSIVACYTPSPDPPTPPDKVDNDSNSPDTGSDDVPKEKTIVDEVNDVADRVTVKINAIDGSHGSGVVIAKNQNTYYVLTAGHVVETNEGKLLLKSIILNDVDQYDDVELEKSFYAFDSIDLAIVKFNSNKAYPIASLADYKIGIEDILLLFVSGYPVTKNPELERVLTIGFSTNKEVGTIGLAKNASSFSLGNELIYTNESRPGMSGGPIFDKSGRVIGINTGAESDYAENREGEYEEIYIGLSLGIPTSTFIRLIGQTDIEYDWLRMETSTPSPLTPTETDSLIEATTNLEEPSKYASDTEWLNYGNQLWRVSKNKEALEAFDKAIERNGNLYQAYYAKGLAIMNSAESSEDYEAALIAFEKALEIENNFPSAWRKQAEVYQTLGKYEEALNSINQAIDYDYDGQDFALYVLKGTILSDMQRFSEAEETLTQAIKIKPNFLTYSLRGFMRMGLEDIRGSKSDFTKAIQLNPDNYFAYWGRGTVLLIEGDYDLALGNFNQAIEIKDDFALAYLGRGQMMLQVYENSNEAVKDFNRVIEYAPDNADGYVYRGIVSLGQEQYQGAIADFNKGIKIAENSPSAFLAEEIHPSYLYAFRGIVQTYLDYRDRGVADCNQAINLNDQIAEGYFCLGFANHRQKKYNEAITAYNTFLAKEEKLIPQFDGLAIAQIGLIEYEQGAESSALRKFEEALTIVPDLPEAELAIEVILFKRGNDQQAVNRARELIANNESLGDLTFLENESLWGDRLLADTQQLFNYLENNN